MLVGPMSAFDPKRTLGWRDRPDINLAEEVATLRHIHAAIGARCSNPTRASRMRYAVRDEPCMTRLTTVAAMPASTALACGDANMSMIGFDRCACS